MIAFLSGEVAEKTPSRVVLDVGGVGYECWVSSTTSAAVPAPGSGQRCRLNTHMQVRDDAVTLYGFAEAAELEAFRSLIGITGVGPKLALSVLSTFTPDALASIVRSGDERRMATVPGVGKKTASRMVLELKDVFKNDLLPSAADGGDPRAPGVPAGVDEAAQALLSMGFTSAECELALAGYDGAPDDLESAIKYALRRLGSAG